RDDLPRQTDRLPLVRLRRHVLRLGIAVGESRYRRAQRGHRMRLRRRGAYDAEDTLVDPRTVHELRAEPVERGAIGQLTVPEEVADLFERGVAREVVDLVAAVDQAALLSHDLADARLRGNNPFQALGGHRNSTFRRGRTMFHECAGPRGSSGRQDGAFRRRCAGTGWRGRT